MLKKLPANDPLIKLIPIIKLTGSFIDSLFKKYTFSFFKLFWIPITIIKNKAKLNEIVKIIFFNFYKNLYLHTHFNANYISRF